jgi:hypothetical protein
MGRLCADVFQNSKTGEVANLFTGDWHSRDNNPEGIALYSPRLPSSGEATLGSIALKIFNRNALPLEIVRKAQRAALPQPSPTGWVCGDPIPAS